MYIVKFKAREYGLLPSGFSFTPGVSANFLVNADNVSLGTFEEMLSDPSEIAKIQIIDEDKQETVTIVTDLPVVSRLEKKFDYTYTVYEDREVEKEVEKTIVVPDIDPETGEPIIDPETGEPVTHEEIIIVIETVIEQVPVEYTCDVISFALAPAGLKEAVDKNSADIEYIAIMTDIEL